MNRRKFMGLAAGGLGAAGLARAAKVKPVVEKEDKIPPLVVLVGGWHRTSALDKDGYVRVGRWGEVKFDRNPVGYADIKRAHSVLDRYMDKPESGYRRIYFAVKQSLGGKVWEWETIDREETQSCK